MDEQQQKVYNKAVRILAVREHSQAELRRKLGAFSPAIIEHVLSQLQAQGYQSDERFVEITIRSRIANGKGYRFIQQELSQHQITREVIEQTLGAIDDEEWQKNCYAVWQKKFAKGNASSVEEAFEEEKKTDSQEKMKKRLKQQTFLNQRGFRPQDWQGFLT